MSTKDDTTWMPPSGSYPVDVGSSLSGALKANKGLPQAPKLFDRGFYSFRYNFKPESIDLYKPGAIEVKADGDRKTATIERPSTVPGEGQVFTGAETAARDVDCVLIYDEELGTFTLEKLDSLINVTWGGKSTMPSNRPSESPAPPATSTQISPAKKEYIDESDLTAELERELLSVIEDAPPKRSSAKQEPSLHKIPTSSTPNGTSGSQSLPKKPMVKHKPKPKPKEPAQLFMNPNSAAARVANKRSAPTKQEPKPEQKSLAPSRPAKLGKLAGDVKGKGVKRALELELGESAKVQKRVKPSPPPSKTQHQSKPQATKPPPLTAGLPPKPQFTPAPPQPQSRSQPPAKKGFNLELPTGSSSGSSSNPLLAGGGGGTSLSLPTGSSTLKGTQPAASALVDPNPAELSDSESDWDVVDTDAPPLSHQTQPRSEPEPFRLGTLTIEEDPPAGFSATLDIVDGDEDDDRDGEGEGEGEGEDIDVDNLIAEVDEELQGGDEVGEQEGEEDLNDLNEMEDFLIAAVSEQDQEGYQDVENYVGGDLYGDDDSSSSSEDSDD